MLNKIFRVKYRDKTIQGKIISIFLFKQIAQYLSINDFSN